MLLPELAERIASTERERHRTMLKVSELHVHTDRSDADIILSKSWKPADTPEDRCEHARPAVIVLGERQDTVLDVCIAKKQCKKHWPSSSSATGDVAGSPGDDVREADASQREPRSYEERREEERRWSNELRPHALRLFAERTTTLTWSWPMLRHLLTEMDITDPEAEIESSELADLVGTLEKLPAKRYPHVLAVAFALQRSWSRESLLEYAQQLGVLMDLNDLTINVSPVDPAATEPAPRRSRKRKAA
jgi:hypothetical protein